ncbi:MAG: DUF6602 domain-containing protein [Sphingobacteriales bacterium]
MIIEINTIAELLANFIPQGVSQVEQAIEEEYISHPVTIGTMYEGLTKEVLQRSVFAGLNLKTLTNCHIEGSKKEFDVLLIEGDAKQLPFSDRYVVKPEQVIAVIQVKKNLYSSDLADSYENMKMLIDRYDDKDLEDYMVRLLRDGFRAICHKEILTESQQSLSDAELAIYWSLRADALLPVRVVWGFNGFASEHSFRESFYQYLSGNITKDIENYIGYYGPHNFPSLIICGGYSLFKMNGMPFGYPLFPDGSWPFYASTPESYTKYVLELIWTRLSYKFELPSEIFGDDLEIEQVNSFLDCTYGTLGDKGGWHYHAFQPKKEFFNTPLAVKEWEPVFIDQKQFVIIEELGSKGKINIVEDVDLAVFVTEDEAYASLQEFIDKLIATGLVYLNGQILRLLTDQCQCVFLPDGRVVAGENKSGRLTNWVMKHTTIDRQAENDEGKK